ncbi:MAG: radical SAM protein [Firmicutes bacterium]|nr:radical SAM protein [Bacillota bacterium]
MLPGMETAKRFFGEKTLQQLLRYLQTNPLKKLSNILELASKAALLSDHRDKIRTIRDAYNSNPAVKEFIRRIFTELDENVRYRLLFNYFVNASLIGVPKQHRLSAELGVSVPFTILIDPTSNCNLRCQGCWAGAYEKHHTLSFEEVDRIVSEAKELGIHFITMSGGEPLLWPHLLDLAQKHSDVAFMLYTNGTLIDAQMARRMREAGNISPAISLEGWRETTDRRRGKGVFDRVMAAMDHLKENGVAFGISVTVTRHNWEELFSDQFIDMIIEKGALYGWSFHYIPIGSNPDFDLMLTPEQREALVRRVRHIRTHKPIQIADFWNDGHLTGGCIAGGRRYFHINARGDVEPCAFVHFAVDTIFGKSLVEILQNPIFKAYQKRLPFSDNLLRPCPLIDVPEALREIVGESGAKETHPGAAAILEGEHARTMDRVAANWKQRADRIWEADTAKSQLAAES